MEMPLALGSRAGALRVRTAVGGAPSDGLERKVFTEFGVLGLSLNSFEVEEGKNLVGHFIFSRMFKIG